MARFLEILFPLLLVREFHSMCNRHPFPFYFDRQFYRQTFALIEVAVRLLSREDNLLYKYPNAAAQRFLTFPAGDTMYR